ncbi:MAG TPA: condensation domain-containing protein, partial [Gemmatimonadaceae bacterium]
GATEGSIWSIVHDIREVDPDWKSIPYGKPLANQTMHVLDDRLAPMPKGAAGDLYIGGLGLADGYLNDPETTAASFFTHPETGERLYQTGDTARYRDDGVLEFLGRLDDQVKVNGYRIELGEIEATLRRHSDVDDAVLVFVREPEPVLWAYVVGRADPGSASAFEAALKKHCAAALPVYMVPTRIVHLASFPLSANGKVDRKRLPRPAPDAPTPPPTEASLAQTGVSHTLAELWREVLGVEPSSTSNFYALGGTSLAAIRVSSSAAKRGLAFSPDLILRFPVFADCARAWEVSREQQDEGGNCGAWERSIPRVSRDVAPPASFAQQSVWFLEQLHPSMTAYRFQATLHFKGDLSIEALRASLRDIVANHEIYRTTFHWIDGDLRQVVHPPFTPDVPLLEPDHPDLRQIVHDEVRRPCDVGTLPLVRWTLVRLGPQDHVLIHAEHHFCHDGWSFYVFVGELMERYRARVAGEAPRLESPRLQLADVAAWQRSWMETEDGHRQLDYWLKALASRPPPIELPLDRPRPSVMSFEGHEHCELIDHELGARLDAFAQTHGATLYMTMLAAFFALLHRYSRQDDLCIAMPVGNRTSEIRDVMGMLLNMLPLRVDMSGRPTFCELLDRVRKSTAEGHAHADVPWSRIVEAMSPVRDSQRLPLFNICFGLQNPPMNRVDLGALELRMDKEHNGSSKFDLSVIASPACDHILGQIPVPETRALSMYWEYSTALFEESTIRRMAANYRLLLERAMQEPDVPVGDLAAETPNGIFGAVTAYERDATLVDMFQREAERHAQWVAIEGDGKPITYGELDARTTQIARWLVERGVRQEARVAICGPRCEQMLVLMLGVLKAGAAYVPVEPTYPRARKALILEDAQVALILSCEGARCSIDGWREVDVGEARSEIEAMPTTALRSGAGPLSLAYVLYTSGSTGVPKGVMTTHRNVMRLVRNADYAEFGEREVFLHYSPYSFDASTLEIWSPLLNGGRVAVFPREFPTPARLSAFMEERCVTAAWLTAGLFQRFDEPDFARMRGVRQLFVGGDVVSPSQARRAMTALPTTTLIDGYGPTETT